MKKYIILFTMFFFHVSCLVAQPQRLALLPAALNTVTEAGKASTLCIDFFKAMPSRANTLHSLEETEGSTSGIYLQGRGTNKFASVKGTKKLSEEITYFGTRGSEHAIPEYYKTFIEQKTNEYKRLYPNGTFTSKAKEKLQLEIWEFNILDELGYIPHQGNPNGNFINAQLLFNENYKGKYGAKASALDFGREIETLAQYHSFPSKFNKYMVHYEKGTGRYCLFDNEGHIISTSNSSKGAIQSIINDPNLGNYDNVHVTAINFENQVKKDAFLTDAKMEGYRSSKKISFEAYSMQDIYAGGKRYSIPHEYNESDIFSRSFEGTTYDFIKFKFKERTDYKIRNIEVDAISTSKTILSEMASSVNDTFSVGQTYDQLKGRISVGNFCYQFKKQVKRVHNLSSDKDLIIMINYQLQPVGVVRYNFQNPILIERYLN